MILQFLCPNCSCISKVVSYRVKSEEQILKEAEVDYAKLLEVRERIGPRTRIPRETAEQEQIDLKHIQQHIETANGSALITCPFCHANHAFQMVNPEATR
jgi:hypothetical protein